MKLTEKLAKSLLKISVVFTFAIAIIFIFSSKELRLEGELDTDKFNHFGAFMAGSAGIIISFAGTILIYVSLNHQREDIQQNREALSLQIEELRNQRDELELTREVFKKQSLTSEVQRFENTFFNLINLYNSSKKEITYTTQSNITGTVQESIFHSSEAVNKYFNLSISIYQDKLQSIRYPNLIQNRVQCFVEIINWEMGQKLHHCLETYLTILRTIERNGPIDKQIYYEVLKAQTKKIELVVFANLLINDNRRQILINSGVTSELTAQNFMEADFYEWFHKVKPSNV